MGNKGNKGSKRFNRWADRIADFLGWNDRKDVDYYIAGDSYVVCDMRDKNGNLEMVQIGGHNAHSIRKQVAEIINKRK
jgi:hypothetical protein